MIETIVEKSCSNKNKTFNLPPKVLAFWESRKGKGHDFELGGSGTVRVGTISGKIARADKLNIPLELETSKFAGKNRKEFSDLSRLSTAHHLSKLYRSYVVNALWSHLSVISKRREVSRIRRLDYMSKVENALRREGQWGNVPTVLNNWRWPSMTGLALWTDSFWSKQCWPKDRDIGLKSKYYPCLELPYEDVRSRTCVLPSTLSDGPETSCKANEFKGAVKEGLSGGESFVDKVLVSRTGF